MNAALNRYHFVARIAALLAALSGCVAASAEPVAARIPLIHCTDLLFPPDDPDDYFDLASVYAVPEYDLKYVILDQGEKQKERPGRVPVSQLNHITGRNVPVAVGLNQKLRSADDKALEQPEEYQTGVEAILYVLRETTQPVAISVVGSLRDIAVAFNREPELLRSKVSRVYVYSGEASNPKFVEWNVSMDPLAYAGFMRSGVPICWIPCFDGGDWTNGGHASYWKTTQSLLLEKAPDPLLQYFIYGIEKMSSDPMRFVEKPVDAAQRGKLMATPRNMWGGALLAIMAGKQVMSDSAFAPAVPGEKFSPDGKALYGFSEVVASFADGGAATYGQSDGKRMLRFDLPDTKIYGSAMTSATAAMLGDFPVRKDFGK